MEEDQIPVSHKMTHHLFAHAFPAEVGVAPLRQPFFPILRGIEEAAAFKVV